LRDRASLSKWWATGNARKGQAILALVRRYQSTKGLFNLSNQLPTRLSNNLPIDLAIAMPTTERRGSAVAAAAAAALQLLPEPLTNHGVKRIRKEVQLVSKKTGTPTARDANHHNNSNNNNHNAAYGSIHTAPHAKGTPPAASSKFGPSHERSDEDYTAEDDELHLTYMQLLRKNRPFRLYLASYVANHVGEWLTYLASISAIEAIQLAAGSTHTSRTAVSALIIVRLTPNILLSPFGGVLADGLDRRQSMIRLDVAGALVALVFLLAMHRHSIALIYIATFLQECVAGLYEPSRSAIIPQLVPEENHLKLATTLAGLAYAAVAAFGSAAGGFLVALVGIRVCYGTYLPIPWREVCP
jgi:hypothetical protein